jgi:adenosylcobyric acid synthase
MSNNSYATKDGREMGRAQATQAEAARLVPEVFMNPILLKPRKDTTSEIVLMGRVLNVPAERDYYRTFTMDKGIETVRSALAHIENHFDVVLIEGAGSPAEINLNDTEIVNMRVAREADVPVILTADVDRGGALASVVGTLELLGNDRERVQGIIFNKFRGDLSLFESAVHWTEDRTGIKVIGVMPWIPDVHIAGEDSLSIRWRDGRKTEDAEPKDAERRGSTLGVGVVRLPYISNHTDFEAFETESDVKLIEVDEQTPLGRVDAIILPGTKSTIQDMKALRDSGLAARLVEFYKEGGFLFGLCGGYQMLGERIDDRYFRDNDELREIEGLGLLPVVTTFEAEKMTVQSSGWVVYPSFLSPSGHIEGYEIHFGETRRLRKDGDFYPLFFLNGREDGLAGPELRVAGTYLHDAFHNEAFRTFWLNALRRRKGLPERSLPGRSEGASKKDKAYDTLAARMTEYLDVEYIIKLAGVDASL